MNNGISSMNTMSSPGVLNSVGAQNNNSIPFTSGKSFILYSLVNPSNSPVGSTVYVKSSSASYQSQNINAIAYTSGKVLHAFSTLA